MKIRRSLRYGFIKYRDFIVFLQTAFITDFHIGQQKSKRVRFVRCLIRHHIDFHASACYVVYLWNLETSLNILTARK